jgi:divalent metal cation (Fe/Co/Zn/Cd) transporter
VKPRLSIFREGLLAIGSIQSFTPEHLRKLALAKRVTIVAMAVSGMLSATKLIVGWIAHSTAVFADGLENATDLFGSALVLYALHIASKPPDSDHPYGHGRSETIGGLAVGFLLGSSGILICYESIRRLHVKTELPDLYAIWPMVASIVVKTGLSIGKFRFGRGLGSAALVADAWHDGIEIASGAVPCRTSLALAARFGRHFSVWSVYSPADQARRYRKDLAFGTANQARVGPFLLNSGNRTPQA